MTMDREFMNAIGPYLEISKNLPKLAAHDIEGRRRRFGAVQAPPPTIPEDVFYSIVNISSNDGTQIPIYHFQRKSQGLSHQLSAAVVHAHGGGLIALSPEISIQRLADITHDTGVQVFSVDYRLAPEHQYPAALDDCWTCLMWLHSKAEELGVDPSRMAVMGESAGGGLAAAMTLRARDLQLSPPIACQILAYPMLDDRTTQDAEGFTLWDATDNLTGWTAYLGKPPGGQDVPATAAPGRIEDAKDLPPLYLDGGQKDIFAKENINYVEKFLDAGIATECHLYPGLPHGFDAFVPTHSVSRQLEENRKRVLRNL